MSINQRKHELPWLNLIFCAMVLWSHCSAQPITHLDRSSWQFLLVYLLQRLSYVSVYGFFLLSGIKLTLPRSKQPSLPTYWGGRMKSIFLPYLLAVGIYQLWFSWGLHYFPLSLSDFFGYVARGDLSSHFYFVVGLFQFVLLAPLFRWLSERWSPALLLPFALGITWFSAQYLPALLQVFWPQFTFRYADRVFLTYLFYYLAGCYIGRRYEAFVAALRANRGLVITLFVLFTWANLFFCWRSLSEQRTIPFLESLHMLYILSAILFFFWVAEWLPKKMPNWLVRTNKASYLIYLYHCLVVSMFDFWTARLGGGRIGTLFVLRLLFVYSVTLLACVLWQHLRASFISKCLKKTD
ncbi:MAG: acyltransferase [Lawsonibacter sp.]